MNYFAAKFKIFVSGLNIKSKNHLKLKAHKQLLDNPNKNATYNFICIQRIIYSFNSNSFKKTTKHKQFHNKLITSNHFSPTEQPICFVDNDK